MCEQVIKRVTLGNFPAVGVSDDKAFFVGKTSIQYLNPFQFRFSPSTTKMSKNASVTVLGAFQYAENEFGITGDFTNRHGLHIYLRRACPPTNGKGFDEWSHAQSIIRDGDGKLLQVNEAAVSVDGSSIITLSLGQINSFAPPSTGPQIYVYERDSTCGNAAAQWSIQQTFLQEDFVDNSQWNLIAANDDQTILFVQFTIDNHFAIYTRERAQKKTKCGSESLLSPDGYKFKLLQSILFADIDGATAINQLSALSHDGKTLIATATFSSAPTLRAVQFEYDCQENRYVVASTFAIDASSDYVLQDIKFGGACSERLFFLGMLYGSQSVKVHSRKPKNGASNCVLKTSLRSNCCGSVEFVHFSADTLVGTVANVTPTTLVEETSYKHTLLTEPVNGDFFIVYSTIVGPSYPNTVDLPIPQTVSARAFRQKACVTTTADEWCSCEVDEVIDFPELVYYAPNAYDMLSFQSECQRFNYPLRQQILPIQFPPVNEFYGDASRVYVSDPDGCFYLTRYDPTFIDPEAPPFYWYYFRVAGSNEPFVLGTTDGQFGEISNGVAYAGSIIPINAKTCAAKYLDIKVVDARANPVAPSPMDLLVTPSLVYRSLTIPMRLCFGVLGFVKSQ